MNTLPPLLLATLGYYRWLTVMLSREVCFFLLRGRLPRLVLMDRGARIHGVGNTVFAGPAKIGAFAQLHGRYCRKVNLGRNFSLGDFSIFRCSGVPDSLCPGVEIGGDLSFGPYCNIGSGFGLSVGDSNIFGPYVSIHPEYHVTIGTDVPIRRQGVAGQGIGIGRENWFGAKATVVDGVILGDGNVIAAAAVLTKGRYGSGSVFGGVPAKELVKRKWLAAILWAPAPKARRIVSS